MVKTVLIVTNSGDLHADLIVPILTAKGCTPFRINLDQFPRDYTLTQAYLQGRASGELRHLPSGARIALDDIGAVWARKAAEFSYRSDLSLQEGAYAKLETEQALFGLLYAADCYWIGHPVAMRAAMWKGEQLQRAQRFGFRIPDSIVSNCPEQVRAFRQAVGADIIFKSMSTPLLAADSVDEADRICDGITTTLITEDMMDSVDAVGELACHFQQYIPKQYELRVTVVGQRLFAAKIHTQDDARTMIDSRDMSAEIAYEACTLPGDVAERCLAFVASYGLHYGALDLIVTPEGEYVFLENNPGGQFLFIEQLIPEFKILDTIAATLCQEATCRSH